VQGEKGEKGDAGEKGEKGDPGTGGGTIFAGSLGLSDLSVQVTNCPSSTQDQTDFSFQFDLGPGYYRPVFTGSTSLGHVNGGVSEIAIQVQPTMGGLPVSQFSKSVSSNGTSEQTFGYFYLDQPGQLAVFTRVSTNCGNASLSGVLNFERVSD
jgi:hypothetical protein